MEIKNKNVGVVGIGVKTEIITPKDNLLEVIKNTFTKNKNLLENNDIVCITEAVVAITQNNFVQINDITQEIKQKLNITENSTIGIIYPILSRNRFSMILKAIAKCVPKGKIIVQLSFPSDEQGNPVINKNFLKKIGKQNKDKLTLNELPTKELIHPITGINYIEMYQEIIQQQGAKAEIYLANNTKYLVEKKPEGIIVCNVHNRQEALEEIKKQNYKNGITLQDICSNPKNKAYCEWGLLGSNILDPEKELLKLAPKNANVLAKQIQTFIKKEFKKNVEIIIYGDGAYKDPETGIYELADPVCAFGITDGIKNKNRIGVKTKYLMQKYYSQGKTKQEILKLIQKEKNKIKKTDKKNEFASQGTTPRKIENLVSSLADLISGSADANTPIVIVKNYLE